LIYSLIITMSFHLKIYFQMQLNSFPWFLDFYCYTAIGVTRCLAILNEYLGRFQL
jgi:hypothetical protein